jgi:uncharacterized protein (TIGR02246 family)
MKTHRVVAIVLSLTSVAACAQPVDIATERAAVQEVVNSIERAMETEDMSLIAANVAHDPAMINFGTDAMERWVGYDALEKAVAEQFGAFDDQQVEVRDQVIQLGAGGTTAWYSQRMDWSLVSGEETVQLEGMRATGVLEKREGRWVLVQMHFSVGVQGQAATY